MRQMPSSTLDLLSGARRCGAEPIRVALDDVPERERPGIYREMFRHLVCCIDAEPLRDAQLEVDVVVQAFPGVRLCTGRIQGARNARKGSALADGKDGIWLVINLRGTYQVSLAGNELVLGDGEATLVSLADPFEVLRDAPGSMLVLGVPRRRLSQLVPDLEGHFLRRIPHRAQALRLLIDYVTVMQDKETIAESRLQERAATHIEDLIALVLGPNRDAAEAVEAGGLRAARLYALKSDIAANLGRADLSIGVLAARHRCSPRLIQRLFEAEGVTFSEYLMAQRLARAYRVLSDSHLAGVKVATIAHDMGFSDLSYFNRVFRRRYGAVPSDVRAQAEKRAARLMQAGP
jgi:AraC-like DNA-binding protein